MTSEPLSGRLRRALLQAMKDRDAARTNAYRSVLSALDNAGAVPTAARAGAIEEAAVGVGSADVARREVTQEEAHGIALAEATEREEAAAALPEGERGTRLRAEAEAIRDLLAEESN